MAFEWKNHEKITNSQTKNKNLNYGSLPNA